ncbi:hypothetical protein BH10ACI1_BH10ACI1_19900 [soil metagenome]
MMEYNFQIDSAAVSDRGLSEKRPQNEDSFLEIAEHGIFAVADGVGGAQAGDVASSMAMEILGEAFVNTRANSDAEELMKMAIDHANTSIYQMSRDLPQLATMATTIVALHVSGNIATIGHVGDSRLYRLDGKGNLYRETQDHSVVEEEVRAGRMTPAQAANHPSRNVISRALGAEQGVEIDMKTIMFEPQTSFLICSDGITRHIDDFEIRQLLLAGGTPEEICAEMKKICYERGAEDNLTAVIVRVSPAVAPAEQFVPLAAEVEEATVAAARPPQEDAAQEVQPFINEAEIPTQNLVMPQVEESKIPTAEYPTEEPQENFAVAEEIVPPVKDVEELPFPEEIQTVANPEPEAEVFYSDEPQKQSGGGFFGKLLLSLLFLLIGAALGAGGYYYWQLQNKQPEIPQLPTNVNSTDTAILLFEKGRRTSDSEPDKYIEAHNNKAQNAQEFYFLGRAFLLNGNFDEAEKNFLEAQKHVSEVAGDNQKTLEKDIKIGLLITGSDKAQKEEFKKKMNLNNNSAVPTNPKVNSSTENKTKDGGATTF